MIPITILTVYHWGGDTVRWAIWL